MLVIAAKRPSRHDGGMRRVAIVTYPGVQTSWIPDHLGEDLSVPALARRACMSERDIARAFRRETGSTPAAASAPRRQPDPGGPR